MTTKDKKGAPKPATRERVSARSVGEWIGGRLPSAFRITEGVGYRPDIVLWLDAGEDLLVGANVIHPDAPISAVAEALAAAIAQPHAGPPRRPGSIRVADKHLVASLRAVVGPGTPIDVAPTPELDRLVEMMGQKMAGGAEPSYFEGGAVSAATLERLFAETEALYTLAPWKDAADSQVLRLDVPELGVSGACLSVIGALGESFGVLVFESLAAFHAMGEAGEAVFPGQRPPDFGSRFLSINFEAGCELSKTMRREVAKHGWPVASARAYPVVTVHERDGSPAAITERDMAMAIAATAAVTRIFANHRALFAANGPKPVTEQIALEHGGAALHVRVTAPHPEAIWSDEDDMWPDEAERQALVDGFLAVERAAGRGDEWLASAGIACETLLQFHEDSGADLDDPFKVGEIEDLLLHYVPRHLSTDAGTIAQLPDSLIAFLRWLVGEGYGTKAATERLCKAIERSRPDYVRKAGDPANFGVAKTLLMKMIASGVDPTEPEAVEGFVKAHNVALAHAEPSTGPATTKRGRKPTTKKR